MGAPPLSDHYRIKGKAFKHSRPGVVAITTFRGYYNSIVRSMSEAQGEVRHHRRGRRGGSRGARPTAPDSVAGGPIRPRTKKPPPAPTGELCGFGLCCHFGTNCVNAHTVPEADFFRRREALKLQLREMALEVEAKKVAYKKAKLERKPLQEATNRGAAKQPTARQPASSPAKKPAASSNPPSPPSKSAISDQSRKTVVCGVAVSQPPASAPPATVVSAQPTAPPPFLQHQREQQFQQLCVFPVGQQVQAQFTWQFFSSVAHVDSVFKQDLGSHALITEGTGWQKWQIAHKNNDTVYLSPVGWQLPITCYTRCPVTLSSVVDGQVLLIWSCKDCSIG